MKSGFNGISGSSLAASLGPEEAAAAHAISSMKEQLLIVLINRLGGDITVPVSEIDGTGQSILSMAVDPMEKTFRFVVTKKS